MKITLPFREEFKDVLLRGRKTWTTRTKRYGKVGDTFEAFGQAFQLRGHLKMPLGAVAHRGFFEEGFDAPIEFIQVWCRIHPRKGYDPQQEVGVHCFEQVKGEEKSQQLNYGVLPVFPPRQAKPKGEEHGGE